MVYREVHLIEIKEILIRLANTKSIRSVSASLNIHRKTIKSYMNLSIKHGFNPLKDSKENITDDLVSKIKEESKDTENKKAPRDELLFPLKDKTEEYFKKGLKGSKIIILLKRKGINVEKHSFYRFVKNNCRNYLNNKITVRLAEVEPAKYAQADFGKLGNIVNIITGELKTTYGLIITLAFSRHAFVYIVFKQTLDEVIAGFEAAWAYFGGIPEIVIVDNLKPAVTKPGNYDPVINKTFLEYSQFRGFTIDPCAAASPKQKPIVERMVPYVRENFFKGESFTDVSDCQQKAEYWCSSVAGARIHGTTKIAPLKVFEEIEKDKLIPYPYDRYSISFWAVCKVHPDHHIRFKNSLYSLPTKYIGKSVEVRGDSAVVKIYHNGKIVKIHKSVGPGKRSTDFEDYPENLSPYTLRNPKYQIDQGYKKSKVVGAFIEEMLTGPYPWHRLRSAQKILRLSDKYGAEKMDAALVKAKYYNIYDMRRIENILKNGVENIASEKENILSKPVQLRFIRESSSFNHRVN
jgi:hypothetical protein